MDPHPTRGRQMNKSKIKKRFSDEQIRLLESMFISESRPESQAKQHIADQLGLKPRQVAIWFQNRRARCKLKQIDHEYRNLKASYDNLATRFESLKKEHHHLTSELQRLKGSEDIYKETRNSFSEEESKLSNKSAHDVYAHHVNEFQGVQGNELLNMVETLSGSPLSSGNGYSLESVLEADYYFAEENCCSEWWQSY